MTTRRVMLLMPGVAFAQAPTMTPLERRAGELAKTPRDKAEAVLRDAISKDAKDAAAMLLLGIVRLEALKQDAAALSREVAPLLQGAAEGLSLLSDRAAVLEVQASLAQQLEQADRAKELRTKALEIRQRLIGELFPSAAAPGAAAVKVGNGVNPPKLTTKREPEYRPLPLFARWQGSAVLSIVVGKDGSPYGWRVVRGLGLGLDEQAVAAVRGWRFAPAQRNGDPVSVEATIEVNFRLL